MTGTVGLPAVVLFAVIFFWTPPHFWALAMKFRDDYAAASVPMLPVVAPPTVVARKILIYSYVMVATTLALAPYAGWLYTASAVGLGAWFLLEAHRLQLRIARIGDGGPPAAAAVTAGAAPAGATPAEAAPAGAAPAGGSAGAVAQAPAGGKVAEGSCAGVVRPSGNPAPMRLFHLSIAYLTLLFAVIAVASLLPWGSW